MDVTHFPNGADVLAAVTDRLPPEGWRWAMVLVMGDDGRVRVRAVTTPPASSSEAPLSLAGVPSPPPSSR